MLYACCTGQSGVLNTVRGALSIPDPGGGGNICVMGITDTLRGKIVSVAFFSKGRVHLSGTRTREDICISSTVGIRTRGTYVCLMFSPRGCVSVMVYNAPRVSVFYRVSPVLNRPRYVCFGHGLCPWGEICL